MINFCFQVLKKKLFYIDLWPNNIVNLKKSPNPKAKNIVSDLCTISYSMGEGERYGNFLVPGI